MANFLIPASIVSAAPNGNEKSAVLARSQVSASIADYEGLLSYEVAGEKDEEVWSKRPGHHPLYIFSEWYSGPNDSDAIRWEILLKQTNLSGRAAEIVKQIGPAINRTRTLYMYSHGHREKADDQRRYVNAMGLEWFKLVPRNQRVCVYRVAQKILYATGEVGRVDAQIARQILVLRERFPKSSSEDLLREAQRQVGGFDDQMLEASRLARQLPIDRWKAGKDAAVSRRIDDDYKATVNALVLGFRGIPRIDNARRREQYLSHIIESLKYYEF